MSATLWVPFSLSKSEYESSEIENGKKEITETQNLTREVCEIPNLKEKKSVIYKTRESGKVDVRRDLHDILNRRENQWKRYSSKSKKIMHNREIYGAESER